LGSWQINLKIQCYKFKNTLFILFTSDRVLRESFNKEDDVWERIAGNEEENGLGVEHLNELRAGVVNFFKAFFTEMP